MKPDPISESASDQARWAEAKEALKTGDRIQAIALFRALAQSGDWRASLSLGYIYESLGPDDRSSYIQAAHWFSNALSKEERPEPRMGLARYFYYGLGTDRDLAKAFEHLRLADPENNPEAAVMIATIYFSGHKNIPRDWERAKYYYGVAINAGYPFAMLHMSKIEFTEGRWGAAARAWIQGVRKLVSLRLQNDKDPRLFGFFRRH